MKSRDLLAGGCAVSPMLFYAFWVIGSVLSIIKLIFKCDWSSAGSWKAEILYAIGTFTPLGGIIGWCDFGN